MFYLPGVLKSRDSAWLAMSIERRIARIHSERRIDMIDAHFGYPEGTACVAIGKRLGIPVLVTIRGFEQEFAGRRLVGRKLIDSLRHADGVVAVSHSLESFAVDSGVPADRVRVIHNAVDPVMFQYGNMADARRALGVEDERTLVVSVGHLVSVKRYHVLIDGFSRFAARNPGALLVIVGASSFERTYPAELQGQVRRLGLEGRVRFTGNLAPAEVAQWLKAADLFVLVSAREGCCNAVLEALAVGVPVVTTPVGDNARFVEPDRNGLIVPVDDPGAIADAIGRAVRSGIWNRKRISTDLHQQVGDWTEVGRRVLRFTREILARRIMRTPDGLEVS
jgi:glycosyltransferase involved in cell wall biosynthesis